MQAQARQRYAASEETVMAFKRHILTESAGFASEPHADAFRVNLLSGMLDRYDQFCGQGMTDRLCCEYTIREFAQIAVQMREMGFEEIEEETTNVRWPLLPEQEAQRYIRERDAYMHRIAFGVFLCTACLVPMMLLTSLGEAFYILEDFFALFGLVGMFAMIGAGVYSIVTAVKPKGEKQISQGQFSMTRKLRARLEALCESMTQKARKRRGRGVALCVMSLIPTLFAAALSEVFYSDVPTMLGVAGMFIMIAAGVYELVMAGGEKKTVGLLLKNDEE